MRVVCPVVRSYAPALYALDATGWPFTAWGVGGSDEEYYELLSDMWALGQTFAIVEHDICVHNTAPDELAACPHDWCSFPFDYVGKLTHGLGCAKFGADLIARHPDAMERVGWISDPIHPRKHWCRLDAWLTVVLAGLGEERHEHETVVRHVNPGCSHGCVTTN